MDDFHTTPTHPAALSRMGDDFGGFDNAHGRYAPEAARTWHSRRPVFSLDRIYTRNLTVTAAKRLDGEPWSHLSDHLPLVAELKF